MGRGNSASDRVTKDQGLKGEVYYQCKSCNFVLKQERSDPPPSYCPQCAVNHVRGEMALMEEYSEESNNE
ncbi:MAG: hypothetical protein JRJ03_01450 [Deltaproteobacteria bacterium]|nr:hypothetical protein [Deltaproteobacteria bacterium]